jgi:polyhydroxyalkanoate synthesis regulator phasin
MVFRVEDFHDLVRLLEERPEWRAELRRLVLTEDLLAMPEQMAALRQETEQRFQALARQMEALTERVDSLAHRVEALTTQVEALTAQLSTLTGHVGELRGESLERRYRGFVYAYFASLLRRPHVLTPDETVFLLEEAIERGMLAREQAHELSLADIIVRGSSPADGSTLYLVVEVSAGIGVHDVTRAVERASLLERAGVTARPVVAGQWVMPEAVEAVRAFRVWQLTDGQVTAPSA